ncbi:MAG: hypothetical protein M0C28_41480 [Candidatus Moduliflexus flocculans]|nr:hypothetical protein [Candidatus Moduliflexus flocculans]
MIEPYEYTVGNRTLLLTSLMVPDQGSQGGETRSAWSRASTSPWMN